MVILRPTAKLRKQLPVAPLTGESDTALGDWYVTRLNVGSQPLLLLVSSESLLTVLAPARDVRSLPGKLAAKVGYRLLRLAVSPIAVARELEAMDPVAIAATADRSVLGSMNEFVFQVSVYYESRPLTHDSLNSAEDWLADTPCRVVGPSRRSFFPIRKAPELLDAKLRS